MNAGGCGEMATGIVHGDGTNLGKEPEMDHRIHVYLAWFMNSLKMQEISLINSN